MRSATRTAAIEAELAGEPVVDTKTAKPAALRLDEDAEHESREEEAAEAP